MSTQSLPAQPRTRRRWPDAWLYAVAFFLLVQVFLYSYPHLRPGTVGWLCWMLGSDRLLWWIIAFGLLVIAVVWSLWRPPPGKLTRWRLFGVGAIVALAVTPLMYRVYPSSYEDRPSEVRFRLPLDGPILVGWGGNTPAVNYHVSAPAQRWAYDLVVAEDRQTHTGDGDRLADYYCYDRPVLAPAAGEVVAVLDGQPDQPPGLLGGSPAGGNQIVIRVADGQYLFLCHLRRGTLQVQEGGQVVSGQPVASVGNSGNTSEPHLHIHLQNTPNMNAGEGIPLYFHHYRCEGRLVERGMPTGGFSLDGPSGQIVSPAATP
ncbi:MAG: M23 family metallopeptidase [Pirellulaceae bacterium]